MSPRNDEGQQHPGLYWWECSQQMKRKDGSLPAGIRETASAALRSILGIPVKKDINTLKRVQLRQDDYGAGAHGVEGEAEGTGFVQPE